jgi:hypothetical protein
MKMEKKRKEVEVPFNNINIYNTADATSHGSSILVGTTSDTYIQVV